jgi:hypothetical protein
MNPTKSTDQQISNKSAGVENNQPTYKEKRKKKGKKKKTKKQSFAVQTQKSIPGWILTPNISQ